MSDTSVGTKVKKYLIYAAIFIVTCAVIITVDQITKLIVYKNIYYGSSIVLIPGLLELSHVHNTGAAWGMFNQHTGLLSAVTILACAMLSFLYFEGKKKLFRASLLMVIGGALGNLIDRIARGYVIDFIKVWIFKYEFPNFNVADSCITIGCVLMIIAVLTSGKSEKDMLFRHDSILGKLVEKEKKKAAAKEKPAEPEAEQAEPEGEKND